MMVNQKEKTVEINIFLLIQSLWHHAWIIILATAVAAMLAVGYAQFFVTPTYSATAKMHVTNNASKDPNDDNYISSSDLTASQTLVKSYQVIMETPETLIPVIEKTGGKYTYEQLLGMISSGSVNNTEIFYIRVVAPSPEDAALIANTICEVLPQRISETFTGSSTSRVQEARIPEKRSAPVMSQYFLIGAIAGFALSCLLIVVTEMMDRVIRDEDYPTETYGMRTLAAIPDLMEQGHNSAYSYEESNEEAKSKHKPKLKRKWKRESNSYSLKEERKILCDKLQFHAAEAYKMLRTNLLLSGEGCQVIGVTSSSRNDGKSTMTINLAYTLAQSQKSVLLIEADLRKPVVAKRLTLLAEPGLSDVLSGKSTDAIQPSGYYDNWKVMCAGTLQPNPSELLSSQAMVQLLQQMRNQFDIILVDLPPVNEVTDALAISDSLDSMLMVVRQNGTTKPALESGMGHMAFSKAELAGFVVTNTNYGGGKYGYYSSYGRYGFYGRYGRYTRYGQYGYYAAAGEAKNRRDLAGDESTPAQGSSR